MDAAQARRKKGLNLTNSICGSHWDDLSTQAACLTTEPFAWRKEMCVRHPKKMPHYCDDNLWDTLTALKDLDEQREIVFNIGRDHNTDSAVKSWNQYVPRLAVVETTKERHCSVYRSAWRRNCTEAYSDPSDVPFVTSALPEKSSHQLKNPSTAPASSAPTVSLSRRVPVSASPATR